mgnify:CR=1 FL=1
MTTVKGQDSMQPGPKKPRKSPARARSKTAELERRNGKLTNILDVAKAMGAIRDDWWEAAQVSSATRTQFWRRVGVPVLTPFIGAGWLLIFTWSIGIYFLAALVVAAGLAFLIASADAFNSVAHAEHPSRHGAKAFGAQDAGFLIAFALAMAMIWAPEYSEMSAHDGFDRPFIGGVELAPWIMGLNVALSLAVTILWFWRDSAQTTSRSASRVAGGLLFWAPGILLLAVFEPSTSASVLAQITGTFAISIGGALAAPLLWSVIMARAPTRHPTLTLTAWSLGTSLVASYLIGPIVRRDEGLIPEVLFSSVGLALGLAALILARRRVKAC